MIPWLLLPLMTFGAVVAAMLPDSAISQYYFLGVLAASLLGIAKAVLIDKAVHKCHLALVILAPFLIFSYVGCVVVAMDDPLVLSSIECIKIGLRLASMPIVFFFSMCQDWTKRSTQYVVCIAGTTLLFPLALVHFSTNNLATGPVFLDLHSNSLGLSGMLAMFVAALFLHSDGNRVFCGALLIAGLLAVVFSVSRTVYVCVALSFVFLTVVTVARRHRFILNAVFVSVVFLAIWGTTQFHAFLNTSAADRINNFSQAVLGKKLDSGRVQLWDNAFQQLRPTIWFGRGTNAREYWEFEIANGKTIKLSVHNYYLAVLQETGAVGLCLVVIYFAAIWNYLVQGRMSMGPRLGMTLFLVLLVHQTNEVTLTTGNFQMSVAVWTVLGAAASFVLVGDKSTYPVREPNPTTTQTKYVFENA